MDRFVDGASIVERATDQLVDEICERHIALWSLVDAADRGPGPPVGNVREIAAELIGRLITPATQGDSAAILDALWPPRSGTRAAPWWWATPLGQLLAVALGRRAHIDGSDGAGAGNPRDSGESNAGESRPSVLYEAASR